MTNERISFMLTHKQNTFYSVLIITNKIWNNKAT